MSKYGHGEAGKGDQRRPAAVSDAEFERRWKRAFRKTKCPSCGYKVDWSDAFDGADLCPWCGAEVK